MMNCENGENRAAKRKKRDFLPVPKGLSDERLVFLDYDGVLTSNVSGKSVKALLDADGDRGKYAWDGDCLGRLRKLCLDCGYKVVIASNWRKFDLYEGRWNGFANPLKDLLFSLGNLVIGYLPCGKGMTKSEALEAFFRKNRKYRGKYVIFDDDLGEGYQFGEHSAHFVLTDGETGLSEENVAKAKEMLEI